MRYTLVFVITTFLWWSLWCSIVDALHVGKSGNSTLKTTARIGGALKGGAIAAFAPDQGLRAFALIELAALFITWIFS
jgi:hypothetical protein